MTDVLAVHELRKTFRLGRNQEIVAVDGATFNVRAGASTAIVGESGSGKTTVARMLVGLERPTSGTIVVAGRPRARARAGSAERRRRAREAQIVFQDPYLSLDPRQRIEDCLAETIGLHFTLDRARARTRIAELLDQVGLTERHARALPRELSGGQRQRVAIARALAAEPRLVILDEAVAALDVSIQAQILNLLADVRAETGISYLFISHDLAVVRQLTDRALVMYRGRIVEEAETADILDHPRHAYTKFLRDSVPRPGWTPQRRPAIEFDLEPVPRSA
jgi:oligopeptide transport system ATP-binding protein